MYKNRVEYVQQNLMSLASCQADNMSELEALVTPLVRDGEYESIYITSAYIMRFLQLLVSDTTLRDTEIPWLAVNMAQLLSYINACCASGENQSFVFTKGNNKELWELSQEADKMVQDINNCTNQNDFNAELTKAHQFLRHLDFVFKDNEQNNVRASMMYTINQSLQNKTKELNDQPGKNKSFFKSKLSF